MEIVIPLIALGGMYVISNQPNKTCNKNQKSETFENMGIRSNLGTTQQQSTNYLPNTNIIPENYPILNVNQLINTVQKYPNPNTATDKYFNQNLFENKVDQGINVGQNPQEIYSLTGNYLNSEQFKHNNMVPFDGGKVKGKTYSMNVNESVLDNMVGTGSQNIKKIEQAPLFKPEQNMQWNYGMPNQSDFYQSRVNPGMRNNNVKPFDSVTVGPGLNQGYSLAGSGGFNSGMEARDKWLPKTVDELRVDTNPKLEYELTNHEGPANSFIKSTPTTDMLGRVEKNHPDTYFVNSPDRWLTTTGAEKGETLRSIQELGMIKRNDIVHNYTGPAGSALTKGSHAPENFQSSKRIVLPELDVNHSSAVGRGPGTDKDNVLKSHTNYANNRSTVRQIDTIRSGFSGAIGAVIAPIMDIFKPTRKEEFVNNIRIYGEAGTTVPKSYVYNPQDSTPTTIKETTLYSPHFNINNQKENSMYVNNYSIPDNTQRDTTSCEYYTAAGGYSSSYGEMSYDSAYKQHNNDIKSSTIGNRPNIGGTQIFNQQMYVTNIKDDCDKFEGRINSANSRISHLPPSVSTYGAVAIPQYYNDSIHSDRIQPDLLTAFKNNPYTQPLTSAV